MNDATDNPTNENSTEVTSPSFFEPDGRLDLKLQSTRTAATTSTSANQLHQQLTRDSERLRYGDQTFGAEPIGDAVLRFCAASAGEGYLTDDLRAAAMRAYQRQPDDYDAVLGDLVPEDLRRRAREILARQNYFSNNNSTAAADWDVFTGMLEQPNEQPLQGLTTGLPTLDNNLGGLRGLMFLGGDKGVGKSSLTMQMALAALQADPKLGVLFYMLDMPKTVFYMRMLCLQAGVTYRCLQTPGKPTEIAQRIAAAHQELRDSIVPRIRVVERNFDFEVVTQGESMRRERVGLTAESVLQDCHSLQSAADVDRLLLVFDLFQKIDPRGEINDSASRDHHRLDLFAEVMNRSASPSMPRGFPILVTSEIRKDATRSRLTRDDLKGDGRMASDADVVLLMWPSDKTVSAGSAVIPTTLCIDKGREGVVRGDISLWFEHQQFRFHELEPKGSPKPLGRANQRSSSVDTNTPIINPLAE